MLRLLTLKNYVLVDSLNLELEQGFSVLTGETGAGKSILVDGLMLLLGERFEPRSIRPGSQRAELSAEFDLAHLARVRAWLDAADLADDDERVIVRRVLDREGRSRAYINGRSATLGQLRELGDALVDVHGQHTHQSLSHPEAQRRLLDSFAGASELTAKVGDAWRTLRELRELQQRAASETAAQAAEQDMLELRRADLAALKLSTEEWHQLGQAQSRLANAAALLDAAHAGEDMLSEGENALTLRLGALVARLQAQARHDVALQSVIELLEPARIQLEEAARELRGYRERLDLDPGELARVEERLASILDLARRYRVRPEALPDLLSQTEARLKALALATDSEAIASRVMEAEAQYLSLAERLSEERTAAAALLGERVSAMMQSLAMEGGRFEVSLRALNQPAGFGLEQVEFQVASHPKQPIGPLARVASGGELSRVSLAIQVATSEVDTVPTLIFDEVDVGIGGAVAATVGALLQKLGEKRQILVVTHLPQVAAHADHHWQVSKHGDDQAVESEVRLLSTAARVEELARMLGGATITAKTRAHAKELLEQHRRA